MPSVHDGAAALVAAAGILWAQCATASWDPGPSRAVQDGIGYRSNLIDPQNRYAASERRNLGVLLARLGMMEDWTGIGGVLAPVEEAAEWTGPKFESVNDEDYGAYLAATTAPHGLQGLFPRMPVERCWTWGRKFARTSYMQALVAAHPAHEMRVRLIAARHRLDPGPNLCLSNAAVESYIHALGGISGAQWRPWRDYLEGAALFYAGENERAVEAFARIPPEDNWLSATAAYMPVRIAFDQHMEHENARYWPDEGWDEGWVEVPGKQEANRRRLVDAIDEFQRSGLDQGYLDGVLDLRRYAAVMSPSSTQAAELYRAELERHFGLQREPGQSESLYRAFENHEVWHGVLRVAWENPLWQVNRLLAAVVLADNHQALPEDFRPHWPPEPRVSEAVASLSKSLGADLAAWQAYPGLTAYAEMLLAFVEEDHQQVVSFSPEASDIGPFPPDILLLKARSQAAMGQHWQAALTWRQIALRWPALNALAEAGHAAAEAGRFADFARLDWNLNGPAAAALGDGSPEEDPASWSYDHDMSYELTVSARFLQRNQPIQRILREGLARFASTDALAAMADDAALPPVLRWWALEPLLAGSLLNGDYGTFAAYANLLPELARDLARDRWPVERAALYQDILPTVQSLAGDAEGAEGLMTVGYFTYSHRIFPPCQRSGSLWAEAVALCAGAGDGRDAGIAPIALFEHALALFDKQPVRNEAEGRLLRMMINCYGNTPNKRSCLRGSPIGADRETRRGWFTRLHKHFPEAAERTPIWH